MVAWHMHHAGTPLAPPPLARLRWRHQLLAHGNGHVLRSVGPAIRALLLASPLARLRRLDLCPGAQRPPRPLKQRQRK
eukprot:2050341-Alexandrium_andersonii.AAC.1